MPGQLAALQAQPTTWRYMYLGLMCRGKNSASSGCFKMIQTYYLEGRGSPTLVHHPNF